MRPEENGNAAQYDPNVVKERTRRMPNRPGADVPYYKGETTASPTTTTENLVGGFGHVEQLVSRINSLATELVGPRPQEGAGIGMNHTRPEGVLNTLDAAVEIMIARISEANESLSAIERRLL